MRQEGLKYRKSRLKLPMPEGYVVMPEIRNDNQRITRKYAGYNAFTRKPAAIRSRPPAFVVTGTRRLRNELLVQRSIRQMTQRNLANAAGISTVALSNIENGKSTPSVGTALILAEILQVKVEELFSLSNDD